MDLFSAIESRHSTRAFKSTPVPHDLVEKILKAASHTPSYMNTQPWEAAVVSGKKLQEIVAEIYKLADEGVLPRGDWPSAKSWPAEMERRFTENNARRFALLGIPREDDKGKKQFRLGNYKFYGAPCAIFVLMDKSLGQWSAFDLGAYTLSLCLAAEGLGLGSVIQASPTNYPDVIRKHLGIPESKAVVLNVAIGYPDDKAIINTYRSLRVPVDSYVKWYE